MEADPLSAAGKTERFVNGLARGPMMFQIMVNRVVELLDATVLPNEYDDDPEAEARLRRRAQAGAALRARVIFAFVCTGFGDATSSGSSSWTASESSPFFTSFRRRQRRFVAPCSSLDGGPMMFQIIGGGGAKKRAVLRWARCDAGDSARRRPHCPCSRAGGGDDMILQARRRQRRLLFRLSWRRPSRCAALCVRGVDSRALLRRRPARVSPFPNCPSSAVFESTNVDSAFAQGNRRHLPAPRALESSSTGPPTPRKMFADNPERFLSASRRGNVAASTSTGRRRVAALPSTARLRPAVRPAEIVDP